MITNHHEIARSHLVQESLSNLPLGSFYLHRNIWQQTRHFFAVIQHVILTHIRWWQPLFTPPLCPWMVACQTKFQMGSGLVYSFSHSHVHQYNWKSFKPSQTRLFAAFRQFVLNCLVLPLYCPTWRGRVAAVSSHVNSKNWPTCFIASLTKCLPLSELIFLGIPHLGTISVNRAFATAAESCFEVGKASTHFDHMSTITRQCFCFPQGVNSMKSIIRYSNGPAGAGWDAKGVFIPLATLCVLQVTHLLQKISATTVNPFVNHNSLICIIIPAFDTWSNPCVNLA